MDRKVFMVPPQWTIYIIFISIELSITFYSIDVLMNTIFQIKTPASVRIVSDR